MAIRPTQDDGVWEIHFCHRLVARIDQHHPEEV
jgi:hypothetical protein